MIGPEFDRPASEPAHRTLVICSAPRTGSYELCRFLVAAGIGVPHEYFHPSYSRLLAERWAFTEHPLGETQLVRYVGALRRRRAQNGVFATKLQFAQFDRYLRIAKARAWAGSEPSDSSPDIQLFTFTKLGLVYGLGIEFMAQPNLVLGVEFLRYDFNESQPVNAEVNTDEAPGRLTFRYVDVMRAKASWKW